MIIAFYDDCNHWYYLGIIKNKIDKKTNESNDCYADYVRSQSSCVG